MAPPAVQPVRRANGCTLGVASGRRRPSPADPPFPGPFQALVKPAQVSKVEVVGRHHFVTFQQICRLIPANVTGLREPVSTLAHDRARGEVVCREALTRRWPEAHTHSLEPEWVDEVLLAGAADDVCLHLGEPVSRAELRRLVAERHRALAGAGLRRGGSVALCLAPSLAFIANLLASWQIGAQASLLDHRLTAVRGGRRPPAAAAAGRRDGRALHRRPATGLRRDHRARAHVPRPACRHHPRRHPAQLRVNGPIQDHCTRRREPRRRGEALHDDRRRPRQRRAHRVARIHGARARARRRPALRPARGPEPDDPGPDDRGRHPVHRRRWLAADHAAWCPFPHRAAGVGRTSRRSCRSSPA